MCAMTCHCQPPCSTQLPPPHPLPSRLARGRAIRSTVWSPSGQTRRVGGRRLQMAGMAASAPGPAPARAGGSAGGGLSAPSTQAEAPPGSQSPSCLSPAVLLARMICLGPRAGTIESVGSFLCRSPPARAAHFAAQGVYAPADAASHFFSSPEAWHRLSLLYYVSEGTGVHANPDHHPRSEGRVGA